MRNGRPNYKSGRLTRLTHNQNLQTAILKRKEEIDGIPAAERLTVEQFATMPQIAYGTPLLCEVSPAQPIASQLEQARLRYAEARAGRQPRMICVSPGSWFR